MLFIALLMDGWMDGWMDIDGWMVRPNMVICKSVDQSPILDVTSSGGL